MESLESELERARALDTDEIASAIESIGFECTRCGACCTADPPVDEDAPSSVDPVRDGDEAHTATVFPDEVRQLQDATDDPWRDLVRPMPYGLREGTEGETFEWALETDDCGDCRFYAEDDRGVGSCTVHADRPLICATYPFSVALAGTSQPMGEAVDSVALGGTRDGGEAGCEVGIVRAHECEGLGRDISRQDARDLAATLKRRTIREIEEAIDLRDAFSPADPEPGTTVVHDSEGAKHPDGTPIER